MKPSATFTKAALAMSRGTQSTVFGFNVESYQVFMLRHSVGRMVSERLPDSGDHHCPHWMARCAHLDQLWDESVESGQITRDERCLVYDAEEALEEVAIFSDEPDLLSVIWMRGMPEELSYFELWPNRLQISFKDTLLEG